MQKKMNSKLSESDSNISTDEENICEDESKSELFLTNMDTKNLFLLQRHRERWGNVVSEHFLCIMGASGMFWIGRS